MLSTIFVTVDTQFNFVQKYKYNVDNDYKVQL